MKEEQPNIIANYLYNLSYKILAVLTPLITTPYISRVLKAEAIGSYSYTQSIATYFSIFGIMGLNLYGQIQISKVRNDKDKLSQMFCEIFVTKTVTSLFSTILYAIIAFFYRKYQILLYIMGIMIISNIFDISWFFQGLEEFKKIVFRNYIIKILGLFLILCFVKSDKDIYLYALILQGSTFIGNCSLWYKINKYIYRSKIYWNDIRNHIKKCLIFFLPSIATTIYTSTDKVMLGAIINSDYQNGIYDQAHKIEQVIITIVSSMSTVLLPRLAYLFNNNSSKELNKYISNVIKIVGFLEIPMTCGLFGIADVFIPVFLGDGFTECIGLIRIFSLLLLFSGLNTIIGDSCLIAQEKQKKYNIGVFSGAIANIIVNAILIPKFLSYGAAIASLISEIIVFCVFLYCTYNEIVSLKKIIVGWAKYIISAMFMGIVVWLIGVVFKCTLTTLIIQIIIGIIIYITLTILLHDETIFNIIAKLLKIK